MGSAAAATIVITDDEIGDCASKKAIVVFQNSSSAHVTKFRFVSANRTFNDGNVISLTPGTVYTDSVAGGIDNLNLVDLVITDDSNAEIRNTPDYGLSQDVACGYTEALVYDGTTLTPYYQQNP